MQNHSPSESPSGQAFDLNSVVEVVVKAVLAAHQDEDIQQALVIRSELQRLPDPFLTEVINGVMLHLLAQDPVLCRWFILDVFLHDADPEGKADVAERINLMMAHLQSL